MDAFDFIHEHVPFFEGVAPELLVPLAQASHLATFKKGMTVLFKGMTVDALHVVCAGKLSVHVKIAGQSGTQKVAELGPTDVFGETSIFESGTAGATVKAEDDDTVVLVIPQDSFRGLLAGDPAFVARVQAIIASRKAPPPKT